MRTLLAALLVASTTTDLGNLAETVGGDEVKVTVFAKGPQDPHFIEPRPSFIRTLHDADLFVQNGMQLEIGWAPVLLRSARNPGVMPGGRGYLDASVAIAPLEVPTAAVDRSMGDVHPYGNPHYLSDPVNGLRVARLIRDKLIELRPEGEEGFRARHAAFAAALAQALVGAELARRHDAEGLVARAEGGYHWTIPESEFGIEVVNRKLTANARLHADGSASGVFTYHQVAFGEAFQFVVRVTCMSVHDGNRAKVGGVVEVSNDPTLPAGVFAWLQMIDNGEGAGANADRSTLVGFGTEEENEAFCAAPDPPRFGPWDVIGNIRVE